MKQGDVGSVIFVTCKNQDLEVIDLTDVILAILVMKVKDTKFERAMQIVGDPKNGQVQYVINTGDLGLPGELNMEVRLVYSNGNYFTCRDFNVEVEARL
jgi:hypothetical protein